MSPRDEQPAPIAEGGLHAHDRDGALAPDEVERTGREVQPFHVSNTGFEPVRDSEALRLAIQKVDKRRVIVDGNETRR